MSNKERLFIVLNDQFLPPKEFNEKRITFTDPVAVDQYDRNTMVTVTGIPGKGYYGEVDVFYNRLQLEDYVTDFEFRSLDPLSRDSVAEALSRRYELSIDPSDFTGVEIPPLGDGESFDGELVVDPTSLQWVGSVIIRLEHGKSWLDTMVGSRNLDVHRHPNPSKTKRFAKMDLWGIDFSAIQWALKPNARGEYTDWDTVRAVCRSINIPDWTKNRVIDRATADVPDSNPAFQRVVIQDTVSSGLLQGPIYFHYNPA